MPFQAFQVLSGGRLEACEPVQAIACLAEAFQAREIALFYGAGLSYPYPSLLPMAAPADDLPGLREMVRNTFLTRIGLPLPPGLVTEVEGLSLEVLLDYFSRYLGPGLLELYDVLRSETYSDPPRPNLRHAWLALLAQRSLCTNFLTVNFDLLDVGAFRFLGVPVEVPEQDVDPERERQAYTRAARPPHAAPARIFKLHGLLEPGMESNLNLLATVERVGSGLPRHKNELLEAIVQSQDLLFFGYSDRDIDVFPQITSVRSPRRFFWFELRKCWIAAQVREALAERQGIAFVGDPDTFLLHLSTALGLEKAELFAQVGCGSLDELHRQHAAAAAGRAAEIARFQSAYAEKFFPTEIPARLLLANMIIEARWGFADFLDELAASIPRTRLEPQLEYAREKLFAEHYLTRGKMTEAFHCRRRAIRVIREQGLPGPLRIDPSAALVEQEACCFLEAARIARRGRGLRRIGYLFLALFYDRRSRRDLRRLESSLRPFDTGTFLVMLQFGRGNLLQTFADLLQLWRIRSRGLLARRFFAVLARALYVQAEKQYRGGLEKREMSDHWRYQQMQRIAETLLHQSVSRGPAAEALRQEARQFLVQARGFFDWGRAHTRIYMDIHHGLEMICSGQPDEALSILDQALAEYRANGYLAGMAKSLFYKALACDALGRRAEVLRLLDELNELRQKQI